jgi:eukaryotic-like serine/threonine-protein kinase
MGCPDAISAAERRRFEQLIGTTLGKYTLERLIGVGGMAAVFRATHRNGNRVALKLLHPEMSLLDDLRERFLREGYAANSVDHPGVVRVLDDDVTSEGATFLIMELLDGATLEARMEERGIFTAAELVPLMCQLLEILAAAHKRGVVHRDIKPENLFIQRDGSLKVLDFGIARLATSALATRTGRIMGTPAYMAPEQARGHVKLIDGQTDLWAVGAIFFRALTGHYVYEAETPELTVVRAATRRPHPITERVPSIPRRLGEVIDRALEPAKEDRWPDATAMLQALRAAAGPRPARVAASEPPAARRDGLEQVARALRRREESDRNVAPPARSLVVRHGRVAPSNRPPYPDPDQEQTQRISELAKSVEVPARHRSGISTLNASGAVSSTWRPRAAWQPRSAWPALATALGVAILVMGGALFLFRSASRTATTPPRTATPASSMTGAPAVLTSATTEPPPPPARSQDAAPREQAAPSARAATAPPASQAPAARRGAPRPPASSTPPAAPRASASVSSAPASAASPAPPGASSAPAASTPPAASALPPPVNADDTADPAPAPPDPCNPNYVLDSDGNKHFKTECF